MESQGGGEPETEGGKDDSQTAADNGEANAGTENGGEKAEERS